MHLLIPVTRKNVHAFCKEKEKNHCKMYGYLPWYYYFVTIIINIKNLNILDIDVFFSGRKSASSKYLFFSYYYHTQKQPKKVIYYYAGSLYQ